LAVFLPVLLFGSAFIMDWHTVRRQKWAILLLAAPGVALGTIMTAVLVKYTFPYNWSWTESLLVSAPLT
jgi:NhaP-type Na+/H+ or K+/H+ antiporter